MQFQREGACTGETRGQQSLTHLSRLRQEDQGQQPGCGGPWIPCGESPATS